MVIVPAVFLGLALVSPTTAPAEQEQQRLAVLPVDVLGVDRQQGQRLHQTLQQRLRENQSIQTIEPTLLTSALQGQNKTVAECHALESCIVAVGEQVEAQLVLAITLAGLGDTLLVRTRLFSCPQGLLLQDLQETVIAGDGALDAYATQLDTHLFPEPKRWYQHWWFWTAAGASAIAVITAAAVTAIIVQQQNSRQGVDHIGDL